MTDKTSTVSGTTASEGLADASGSYLGDTGSGPALLVVDDDRRLRELLERYLKDSGFCVCTAKDAGEARDLVRAIAFDLMVLDVMMPGESGLELLSSLDAAAVARPPALMLTARDGAEDRIEGLEAGADDYLTKPFEPRELVLRINAILRRARAQPVRSPVDGALRVGPWRFFPDRQSLERGDNALEGGEAVRLTEAESRLLAIFARAPARTISREALAGQSGLAISERSVDVQITRLRRKLGDDPRAPRILQTVRGQGYVLRNG